MLELFDGQLTLTDIYTSTYKELGYLKKYRQMIKDRKAKLNNLPLKDLKELEGK